MLDIFNRKTYETGFRQLDKRVVIEKGDFVVIAGRPSTAKTSLVLDMIQKNCLGESKSSVGFYSYDLSKDVIYLRLMSKLSATPLAYLIERNVSDSLSDEVQASYCEIVDSNLNIYNCNCNIFKLIDKIRIDHKKKNYDTVYIDYLQLIKSTTKPENRYLEVNEISRELKLLATELQISIVAISQLNRSLENRYDRRPIMSDLRDSGTIEDDANKILFIYMDYMYKQRDEMRKEKEARNKGEEYKSTFEDKPINEVEIIIAKNDNGGVGTIKLDFHKSLAKFTELENKDSIPIEVVFESVGAESKDTNIDIPMIL